MEGDEYKLYSLNSAGRIKRPALSIFKANDADAIEAARSGQDMDAIEIWCGTRKVATLRARV